MSATEALLKSELDLAWQHIFKRDTTAAMAHARKASIIANESPDVAHILGVIANRDGRPDLAMPLLQKALNGGVTERKLRDMTEALMLAKQPQAALAPISDAIQQFGASAESLGLLAAVYVALEKFDEASQTAQQAVALKPNALAWETTIAFCDLIRGQFNQGLKAFTFRPQTMAENGRCPALHLSEPVDLWLKNEQGPGDTLFFLCHAHALVKRGWRLHVQSHIRTQKILESTGLFAEVSLGFNCPKDGFWINIGDLPLAASQLALPAVSAPLSFKAQDKLVAKITKILHKFGPPPYIAVTWRGGVQGSKVRNGVRMGDRYIDTHLLGQTLKEINASIISVQRVPDAKESKAFEAGLGRKFLDLSRLNDNLPEMLALMELVDDYIAVPNTNHHLREALGKPTKIIVNRPYEDWRWAHQNNSPWYPNAVCYRQSLDGDLAHVFKQLKTDLLTKFSNAQPAYSIQTVDDSSGTDENDFEATQVMELLQAGWKAVGANDVPTGIQYAQQVMAISPNNASAFHLLGWAAMRDLKIDLAVSVLKRACELDANDGRIIGDYIRALSVNQQHGLAIEVATTALNNAATNNRSSIHYGRAACYLSSLRLKEAIEDYQSCISINPNRLDAQEYSGMARLKLGDAIVGFRELTARKVAQREELLNDWCCPVISQTHKGSRVLIKRDMGLGDELTYLRYLPWLTAAGIHVDYWAGKKLVPLLERMGYLNHVYPDNQKPPSSNDYDLSFIVNDLPVAAHGLGAPEIAPPLPLSPRPDLVEKWKAWLRSLGEGPYIGINWKAGMGVQGVGNIFSKLAKAVDAEPFAKALSPVNATWISLQRNVLSEELNEFKQYLQAPLHDATSLTDDIEDLLALLSLLDDNIGVSNTNMHLRASLGLGSRVMVQTPGGDWRWGVQGDTSVWFTESRVYRQTHEGKWDAPLQALQNDLKAKYGLRIVSDSASPVIISAENQNTHQTKRLIWLTAGAIKNVDGRQTSETASARYRVITPSIELTKLGWQSEIVNEELSQVMGGWGSAVPKVGDTVIISKVFSDHALQLAKDAKKRNAIVLVDFCDNLFDHPKRGPLLLELLKLADIVVAATDGMANAIAKQSHTVDAVISDPVEMRCMPATFSPGDTIKLLWFGHNNNLDSLIAFLPKLNVYKKPVVLNLVTNLPNGELDLNKLLPKDSKLNIHYIPWSVESTQHAILQSDLVVIPVLDSNHKSAKNPNRLLESLQSGRMVVAGPLPAYLPFADSAWVGDDLITGIEWCLSHPDEVLVRIQQGQADISKHFTPEAIAAQWNEVFMQEKSSEKQTNEISLSLGYHSPLENYYQTKEAARILGLNNHTEAEIKQAYYQAFAKKDVPLGNKIAVYTAIFGGYDTAPILNHVYTEIDYILYTDQADFNAPRPWQVRVVPSIFKDPQVDARRIKVLSHLFLPDYDITVWIDGNFTLEKLSVALVKDIASRAPIALCKHQFRSCIYDEATEILKRGIDASTPVLKQMQYYQSRQFPANFGLHATGFLVRNHQDSHTIKMNMRWWDLLSTNSKRDQLSFDYVRWEMNIPIMPLPFNQRENQLFEWGKNGQRQHKVDTRRNDEHEGRALNYDTLSETVGLQQQYQPLWDSWHAAFLNDLYKLNQTLIATHQSLAPSVLYLGAVSAHCLPDPRLRDLQRLTLSKLGQARRILQIGFDGGHLAIMAMHHSGAKIVIVDNQIDQYKQTGLKYLTNQHAKRVAVFSQQDIMQMNEAMFDLVCFNTIEKSHFQELISQLKRLSKATSFIEFAYQSDNIKTVSEAVLSKDIQPTLIDESRYTYSTYGVWLKNRKDDLTWKFAVQGKYGFFYANWLKAQKESILIDIGANIGLYSLIASTNDNFKAIYSFEPHPETYQFLVDNIHANQAKHCIPHKLAISDKCEKHIIHVKPNHSRVATLRDVKTTEGYQSSIEIECVDAVRLNTLIQNPDNLPISIKIDVKGFELVVIQTLIKTNFWPRITNIYYEVDENYLDYKKVEAILLAEGFKFEAKNGDGTHYDLLYVRELKSFDTNKNKTIKNTPANPSVLIGIMQSGENEFKNSIDELNAQNYINKKYFVIENLPNKLAHDTLYETFMSKSGEVDYFLKLDADMVFAHKDVLSEMVEEMQKNNLAHLFAYVKDCPSGVMIPGIQMFKSDTKWLGSEEKLNVDYPPKVNGKGQFVYDKNWINHMPNPDEYQLFRYGIHKALKSLQPDRDTKKINKGILHLTILNGIARNVKIHEKNWFALIGALLVYKRTIDSIEYNGDQAKNYFNILKNKPEKFEALKQNAEEFWGNEVQVNYWWIENFTNFSFNK